MREGQKRVKSNRSQDMARKGERETEAEKNKQADQITQICSSFATPGLVFAFLRDAFMLGCDTVVVRPCPGGAPADGNATAVPGCCCSSCPLTVTLGQTSVSV